jgi:hypothetical protein
LEVVAVTADQWIERYRRTWETVDADEVVDLFTPDASYRSSVFRDAFIAYSDHLRDCLVAHIDGKPIPPKVHVDIPGAELNSLAGQ